MVGSSRNIGTAVAGEVLFGASLKACAHRLARPTATVHLARGECLYRYGDRASDLYHVEAGQLKMVVFSNCGKACLLAIAVGGDLVGDSCLIRGEHAETAIAMRPTVLTPIPRSLLLDALGDRRIVEGCLAYLAARLSEQQEVIAAMVTMDSEQRLAATLLRLGRKLGRRVQHRLQIDQRITHEELAEMVGTTRSRIGYFLKRFLQLGLVEPVAGSFLAIDEARLQHHLDGPVQPVST